MFIYCLVIVYSCSFIFRRQKQKLGKPAFPSIMDTPFGCFNLILNLKYIIFYNDDKNKSWVSQLSQVIKTVWSFLINEQQKVIIKLITFLILFRNTKLLHFKLFEIKKRNDKKWLKNNSILPIIGRIRKRK